MISIIHVVLFFFSTLTTTTQDSLQSSYLATLLVFCPVDLNTSCLVSAIIMISGLAHVNLTVPSGTLEQANEFYSTTLGLTPGPVPELQKGTLAWFDIGTSSQEVHIAFGAATDFGPLSSRHPCFKLESPEKLIQLRQ
jgi:hypothetical protein